jgi:Tol biopolymer transport system component
MGIWIISVIGSSLKKLRDDAYDAALSPDGSQIAFTDVDDNAIWLMAADGSQARPIIKADADAKLFSPTWFANGKRLFYGKAQTANGNTTLVVESRNLKGGDPVVLLENNKITGAAWGQHGRFIYAQSEPPPNQYDSNLWDLRFDPESGKPEGTPRRLTDWTGFSFTSLGITTDGKHFVFLNDRLQTAAYIGELANGGDEMRTPQRLTLNEGLNWPGGWSPDGKTLFFYSNRDGSFNIYQQGMADRSAQPIVSGREDKWAPQVSPDGKWLIYLQWSKAADGTLLSGKLMRTAIPGGAPESVMDVEGHPDVNDNPRSTAGGFPSFRCPHSGSDCVIAEKREKQIVFSAFDPVKGRKAELVKVPFNEVQSSWDLSPDGKRVAISEFSYQKGEINVVPLDGSAPQKISAMPWTELLSLAWAADGKSLYFASFSSRGTSIVHLDFAGHSKLLVKAIWGMRTLAASPDGKYLAFGPVISNSNAWAMGWFPSK